MAPKRPTRSTAAKEKRAITNADPEIVKRLKMVPNPIDKVAEFASYANTDDGTAQKEKASLEDTHAQENYDPDSTSYALEAPIDYQEGDGHPGKDLMISAVATDPISNDPPESSAQKVLSQDVYDASKLKRFNPKAIEDFIKEKSPVVSPLRLETRQGKSHPTMPKSPLVSTIDSVQAIETAQATTSTTAPIDKAGSSTQMPAPSGSHPLMTSKRMNEDIIAAKSYEQHHTETEIDLAKQIVTEWTLQERRPITDSSMECLISAVLKGVVEKERFNDILYGFSFRGDQNILEVRNVLNSTKNMIHTAVSGQQEFLNSSQTILEGFQKASQRQISIQPIPPPGSVLPIVSNVPLAKSQPVKPTSAAKFIKPPMISLNPMNIGDGAVIIREKDPMPERAPIETISIEDDDKNDGDDDSAGEALCKIFGRPNHFIVGKLEGVDAAQVAKNFMASSRVTLQAARKNPREAWNRFLAWRAEAVKRAKAPADATTSKDLSLAGM
uniref:Protein 2 n=1 Tax=Lupinus virus 1 TaxID=2977974 RepID=A0A9N7AAT4_9RHAB|nr:TPA_asm: protein 2 [Lupinus virus 1]